MSIRIIAVGKSHDSWVIQGIDRYQKRLRRPFDVSWVLLPHSAREGSSARAEESERILQHCDTNDSIVLLDEKGKLLDSPSLSQVLQESFNRSKRVVIIVGGAYGVDERVHQYADIVWSLSPLVFPHQLVRLLLIEQLYRAQEIVRGNPYHHE